MQYEAVDTRSLPEVRDHAIAIQRRLFPAGGTALLQNAFAWTEQIFSGHYPGFQPIDAKYHDLEHTLQGTLCLVRLLEGYKLAQSNPELNQQMFELGVLAILLHDTGYLKDQEDKTGTGAKYTLIHVSRSADFARRLLQEKGFSDPEIRSVQNMIRCTGVNADLTSIPFQSALERIAGFALGTADLLGQMAAGDYVDKLEILYLEFEESNKFSHRTGPEVFRSADDLRRKTPAFWEKYVLPKVNRDFLGLYRYLNHPWPHGRNAYLEAIQKNIDRLNSELAPVSN